MFKIAQATGVVHPGLITVDDIEIADGNRHAVTLREMYGYRDGWGLPSQADREEITRLMTAEAVTTPGGTEASTATS